MSMWSSRFESPIEDIKEINAIRKTPEYTRKAAVPIKAASPDISAVYFQDPILKKFAKMVQAHNNAMLGEQIMMKLYNNIKATQIAKGRDNIETDPTVIIKTAIENVRPVMRLEKVKVGAVIYMVPAPITTTRSYFEGMRWIHSSARDHRNNPRWVWRKQNPDEPVPKSTSIWDALANEILDAYNNTGRAVNKKTEYHRICEQNRAYAHYRRTK